MSKKVVTLKTIAEELNLSITAVSKALRGEKGIGKETVQKVKETAKKMNYQPNSVAKSLRTNMTKTLGLIVSDSSFLFFNPVIEGVEKSASEFGYNIILCNANSNVDKEKEAVRVLANKRVDGIILAASMLNDQEHAEYLDSFGIPYIFAVRKSETDKCDYVINDNENGSFQMVDYLAKTGSSRICFINIYEKISSYSGRMMGYRKALLQNNLPICEDIIFTAKPTVEDGYASMKRIIAAKKDIDAVFCGCDVIAIGVMEAILEAGLKIPTDIRVAGYDDIEYAAYLRVPLTTVRQPKYKMGKMATEVLIDKIQNKYEGWQNIVLWPDLVLRQST